MQASLAAKEAELGVARRRILVLSGAVDAATEAVRPFVRELGVAKRTFDILSRAAKV